MPRIVELYIQEIGTAEMDDDVVNDDADLHMGSLQMV